jgi:hypothetical protein
MDVELSSHDIINVLFRHFLEGTEKTTKIFRMIEVLAEIRTSFFTNTNQSKLSE